MDTTDESDISDNYENGSKYVIYEDDIPKLYEIVFGIFDYNTIPGAQPMIAGCLNSLDYALNRLDY